MGGACWSLNVWMSRWPGLPAHPQQYSKSDSEEALHREEWPIHCYKQEEWHLVEGLPWEPGIPNRKH